jgi:dTDP-glucose 4,6-dehydratase
VIDKNYQPRHLLVTGGAGFIGSNYVRYLLMNHPEIKIINLDLLTYAGSLKNLENLPNSSGHTFIQGNICDYALVEAILSDYEIDTIVHFAAESHVDRSILGPLPFVQTNVLGTFTLIEAARYYWLKEKKWDQTQCRFHHISTDEVYGSLTLDEPPFTTQSRYVPSSPYSASKASSDHFVRAYFHTYGLPITLSNCSNNYGPYQHTEKFIPTIIRSCINEQPIPVYGTGSNIRDWLYVEDHCAGIQAVLLQGRVGETYNIGGNCELSNLDVVKLICQKMDILSPKQRSHETLITFVDDRAGHDFRYAIDTAQMAAELNWYAKESFAEGISKTLGFYEGADSKKIAS